MSINPYKVSVYKVDLSNLIALKESSVGGSSFQVAGGEPVERPSAN